jgi:chromosome transmission fidelity protein 18
LHDNRENSEDESDEKSADDSRLWAEKYRPQRFIELISDEVLRSWNIISFNQPCVFQWLNTEILKWVKHWDRVVFGLEPPKQQQPQVPQNRSHGFLPAGKTVPTDKLGRPEKKILLLTGPPGLGKTTLAHVIARQCNYNAVEVNARYLYILLATFQIQ